MKRLMVVLVVLALMVLAFSSVAMAQTVSPCVGGCDAEYWNILTYDPYEMWAKYGYPIHTSGPTLAGCWWYDVDGTWYYMCPPDGNLYPYGG